MHFIIKLTIAFALSAIGVGVSQIPQPLPDMSTTTPTDKPYEALGGFGQAMADIYRYVPPVTTTTPPAPVYRHGDCSWLPALALKAGWQPDQIGKLTQIALRESGCCIRRGGETVDKDCKITGHDGSNHLSDTSILQINGLNFDIKRNPTAIICLQMKICTQEPLLDPYTNLKAGKVLFDYWQKAAGDGWIPWDMCNRTKTCK
jgi:hypothetical protein